MRGTQHWTSISWVVRAVDENYHTWNRQMGICQKCDKSSDCLFVCAETGEQYCPRCIKEHDLVKVLL